MILIIRRKRSLVKNLLVTPARFSPATRKGAELSPAPTRLLALNGIVFLEEFLDVRALNLLEHFLERDLLDERKLHVGDLLAVAELHGSVNQVAQVIGCLLYTSI